jgi:hypothetical protein
VEKSGTVSAIVGKEVVEKLPSFFKLVTNHFPSN